MTTVKQWCTTYVGHNRSESNCPGYWEGDNGCTNVRNNLRDSGLGGSDVWVVDVGYDTAHRWGLGKIPPQGVPQADEMETL